MNDTRRRYWDDVATEWSLQLPQRTWRAHSDAVNARLLHRWLPTGRRERRRMLRLLKTDAFDEAVSAGLCHHLSQHAETVIAVDISSATLVSARKDGDLVVAAADLRRLPFADASMGAVVSFSSLDHFSTLDELMISLRELQRVLVPGGQLILTLDNLMNPLVALRNVIPFALLYRLGIVPYRVGRTVGPRRLRAILQEAGIEVQEVDAILHVPRVFAVAAARLLDRVGSSSLRAAFLGVLLAFENLSRLPTRFLTGYFIAVRGRRPPP